jgi:hypothetical protein
VPCWPEDAPTVEQVVADREAADQTAEDLADRAAMRSEKRTG